MAPTFMLGAVAYAPKVVTIWEGFKTYLGERGFAMDYTLYSNYETQVQAQFKGDIAFAWNSPLAWVRADRMARARGQAVRSLVMRDSDQGLQSVLVVPASSPVRSLADLQGKVVGFGAIDSPQATLIPLDHLQHEGGLVPGRDYTVRRFDVLGGKHGDHIGGERDAAVAMLAGEVAASWMIAGNHAAFAKEGLLPAGGTRVLATTGLYDHCTMTVSPGVDDEASRRFAELLLAMDWNDAQVRPLLELEGLRAWRAGRVDGFRLLERASTEQGFYDDRGNILASDYRY
ncbi:MAG: phosphate/phosphite/phosphonate ABC transporter substrate-binding protein [Comamonadaceae bacterium]|nr:phosphate/phosphite/phosphonate ABC transporter substrate-binding protein [Burkholderiales bacterium]MEB2349132.1 phosphate/phosphite/phosphonate ABC transporter substrate-binding protein [Comamonadaceae bacterium]